jgi:hypothetical protein
MSLWVLVAVLSLLGTSWTREALAQQRWVDDDSVLAARRVRLSVGLGVVRFAPPTRSGQAETPLGSGLNLEEAAGIGHSLELGARFGLRTSRYGQGLRADEVARTMDTETFGTGLSITANPELRLRWQALRWSWGGLGLEDRVVLPTVPDPDVTQVLGAWTSLRLKHVARVDVALNGVITWQSFARERVLIPSFGVPVSMWTNLTRELSVGLVTALHSNATTTYVPSDTQWKAGLSVGYRIGACDLNEATYLLNMLYDITSRIGAGLGVSCQM